MKTRLYVSAAFGLGTLWLVVLLAIHILHGLQPTAATITAWTQHQDWSSLSAAERARRLNSLADQINRLTFDERQKLNRERALEPLVKQMTDDEKLALLDKTLPRGIEQVMEAINKMKPEDRKRMVDQAVENLKKMNPDQKPPPGLDDAMVKKVMDTGFTSYLQNASAQTKMDMAPLIEQIQINMQGLRAGGP